MTLYIYRIIVTTEQRLPRKVFFFFFYPPIGNARVYAYYYMGITGTANSFYIII